VQARELEHPYQKRAAKPIQIRVDLIEVGAGAAEGKRKWRWRRRVTREERLVRQEGFRFAGSLLTANRPAREERDGLWACFSAVEFQDAVWTFGWTVGINDTPSDCHSNT
jgi:hypothetical protein